MAGNTKLFHQSLREYDRFFRSLETVPIEWNPEEKVLVSVQGFRNMRLCYMYCFLVHPVFFVGCVLALFLVASKPSSPAYIAVFCAMEAFIGVLTMVSFYLLTEYGRDFVFAWNQLQLIHQQLEHSLQRPPPQSRGDKLRGQFVIIFTRASILTVLEWPIAGALGNEPFYHLLKQWGHFNLFSAIMFTIVRTFFSWVVVMQFCRLAALVVNIILPLIKRYENSVKILAIWTEKLRMSTKLKLAMRTIQQSKRENLRPETATGDKASLLWVFEMKNRLLVCQALMNELIGSLATLLLAGLLGCSVFSLYCVVTMMNVLPTYLYVGAVILSIFNLSLTHVFLPLTHGLRDQWEALTPLTKRLLANRRYRARAYYVKRLKAMRTLCFVATIGGVKIFSLSKKTKVFFFKVLIDLTINAMLGVPTHGIG